MRSLKVCSRFFCIGVIWVKYKAPGVKAIAGVQKVHCEKMKKREIYFLTVIKRESQILGIISDKGGLTCHAAIIARELEIPYVAGTKTATQKLKDGMVVTMDGRNGIVYE